jgi:hypothetical protein
MTIRFSMRRGVGWVLLAGVPLQEGSEVGVSKRSGELAPVTVGERIPTQNKYAYTIMEKEDA